VPWIQLPALFGEGSLTVWLLVVGLNAQRWQIQAVNTPARNIQAPTQSGAPA
jgi:hypothetical protein